MNDVSESLLDVDKIKELSLLIGTCDVNESRGLVDPLFELVGVTMHVLYSSFHMPNLSCTVGCVLLHDCMVAVIVQQIKRMYFLHGTILLCCTVQLKSYTLIPCKN